VRARRTTSTNVGPSCSSSPSRLLAEGLNALKEWRPDGVPATRPKAQVLDLFSGCGGMSVGFAALGQLDGTFSMVGGVDVNPASLATYQRNFRVPGLQRDVRELAYDRVALGHLLHDLPDYDASTPLVLVGCAPCQGFSAHAKKRWAIGPDDRNDLVRAFAEVAVSLSPACVVMENVPELVTGRYKHNFLAFQEVMGQAGYIVKWAIHNAAAFGVPQARMRSLVIATRSDSFNMPEPLLAPAEFRTVRQAIGHLPPVQAGKAHASDVLHRSAAHRTSTLDVIRAVPHDGGSRPKGVGPNCLDQVKGFSDVYGRLYWDRPAITLTHYARNPASGRYTHPEQDRGLTMREAALLQSFPDAFSFDGKFDDVFRQIGEAVPPLLSVAVAQSIAAYLNDKTDAQPEVRQRLERLEPAKA
jgi:DNA (cytosine-5)-methyltransferase 1